MAKSILAFFIFVLLFGGAFILLDFIIFNARGLPLIYHAL